MTLVASRRIRKSNRPPKICSPRLGARVPCSCSNIINRTENDLKLINKRTYTIILRIRILLQKSGIRLNHLIFSMVRTQIISSKSTHIEGGTAWVRVDSSSPWCHFNKRARVRFRSSFPILKVIRDLIKIFSAKLYKNKGIAALLVDFSLLKIPWLYRVPLSICRAVPVWADTAMLPKIITKSSGRSLKSWQKPEDVSYRKPCKRLIRMRRL